MNDLAFELKQINKRYPGFALQQLDLELPRGRILSLIGPNGAGKTTTLRLLLGFIQPDSGEVSVLGNGSPFRNAAIKEHIGFASQDVMLFEDATLTWHINYVSSVFGGWDQAYADELIAAFQLKPNDRLGRYSFGQRMKAQLLLTLARKPRLLVLDEPTAGLDPVYRQQVLNELVAVLEDEERAVVLSSHNTHDVEQISDLIAFIDNGRLVSVDDKESYLQRWRRLHLRVPDGFSLQNLPSNSAVHRNEHLVTVTFDEFDEALVQQCIEQGAEYLNDERMTLEEIFIAQVKSGEMMASG